MVPGLSSDIVQFFLSTLWVSYFHLTIKNKSIVAMQHSNYILNQETRHVVEQ
jgi:hypothetical protein